MNDETAIPAQEAFRELAQGVAVPGRRDFYEAMVERLARLLRADHVMIAAVESDTVMARTLAFWSRDRHLESATYPLDGTPCEHVVGSQPCFFPNAVAERFPEDVILAELGVESYLGIPMFTPDGEPVGILAAMTNQRAEFGQLSYDLAGIAAAQAGAELARRRAENAVRESGRRLDTLMAHLPGMAYQCRHDRDWTMLFVNEGAREVTGYTREDFLKNRVTLGGIMHEEDRDRVFHEVDAAVRNKQSFRLNYRLMDRHGSLRWVWEKGQGVFSDEGELQCLEGFILDITEQQQSRHLQQAVYQIASAVTARSGQAFFHGLTEHLASAVGADAAFIATLVSGAESRLAMQALVLEGRSRGAMADPGVSAFTEAVMEHGHCVITRDANQPIPVFTDSSEKGTAQACVGVRLDSKRGEALGVMAVFFHTPIENPDLSFSVMRIFGSGASAEIERQRYDRHVKRLAYEDAVTGLPNRVAFMEQLELSGAESRHSLASLSLVFLDLKRFKELNDTRGTLFGDAVLAAVAERIAELLGPGDYLARLGGNEYAALLPGLDKDALPDFMHRIQDQLETPLYLGNEACSVSACVGGACFPNDADTVDELFQHTSIALHRAKRSSTGQGLYDTTMAQALYRKEDLLARLQEALRQQTLMLHYQPQFDLASGAMIGVEALCRWFDPELGWISPGEFIPLAEERGLIHELSDWVLREGCRQLRAWKAAGLTPPATLSVNISAEQFDSEDLADRLQALCYPSNPEELTLELTESAFMGDPELAMTLCRRLREAGFQLAIDDFGTGYSSLAYLRDFHVDTLKIDMSFVRSMLRDERDRTIVETIVAMARTLDLKTVAEGVETGEHEAALRAMGCGASQGFYYGKPCDAERFAEQWLAYQVSR